MQQKSKIFLFAILSILFPSDALTFGNVLNFEAKEFRITGNLPGTYIDSFDDNDVDPWTLTSGTVTEANGVMNFIEPGTVSTGAVSGPKEIPFIFERSSVQAPEEEATVYDGLGNFTAASLWTVHNPNTPAYFYSMDLSYLAPSGTEVEVVSTGITNLDVVFARMFDPYITQDPVPTGLVFLQLKQVVNFSGQIQDITVQVSPISANEGDTIELFMVFDDTTNEISTLYAINGGTPVSPQGFPPISSTISGASDFTLGAHIPYNRELKLPQYQTTENNENGEQCTRGPEIICTTPPCSHTVNNKNTRYALDFDTDNTLGNIDGHTPVQAVLGGIAYLIPDQDDGFGNHVNIDHGNGVFTVYAHLNTFAPGLTSGTTVAQGRFIGVEGITGVSTGDHIHFGLQHGNPQISAVDSISIPILNLVADANNDGQTGFRSFRGDEFVCNNNSVLYESNNTGKKCSNGVDDDNDNTRDYNGYPAIDEDKPPDGIFEIAATPKDTTCVDNPSKNLEKTQCDDGLDNDGDLLIDDVDLECSDPSDDCEKLGGCCGIGFELIFVIGPLYILYAKRKKFFV